MPIPQTVRVNPLDLQGNIAIGVSLPFNGPSGPFNSTYSTKDQIKSNLINLLLTNKGERVMNPEFGCDLSTVLFEGITEDTSELIKNLINTNVAIFVPEVQITDVIVNIGTDYSNNNSVSVTVNYKLRISQNADQVTVQFI
jgi:phage baseplate assembly protein W